MFLIAVIMVYCAMLHFLNSWPLAVNDHLENSIFKSLSHLISRKEWCHIICGIQTMIRIGLCILSQVNIELKYFQSLITQQAHDVEMTSS